MKLIVGLLLLMSVGCSGYSSRCRYMGMAEFRVPASIGYSGMAQIDDESYLVVHDTKAHDDAPRLGVIQTKKGMSVQYREVTIDNWNHPDGRSSDLESVCAVPNRINEFLIAESGDWNGKYGRIFHLKLSALSHEVNAHVLGSVQLPILRKNRKGQKGDNYEGMACAERKDGTVLIILGERGGSRPYPNGVLRWFRYVPDQHKLILSKAGVKGKPVTAPGPWIDITRKRDIADLYLDRDGPLWAVGSEDGGGNGPFRSVIYKAGIVHADAEDPIDIIDETKPVWRLDGVKVEALSGPATMTPNSPLSFGTEDENYGGIWRPLYPPVMQ